MSRGLRKLNAKARATRDEADSQTTGCERSMCFGQGFRTNVSYTEKLSRVLKSMKLV